jgi:hypothetical protein
MHSSQTSDASTSDEDDSPVQRKRTTRKAFIDSDEEEPGEFSNKLKLTS